MGSYGLCRAEKLGGSATKDIGSQGGMPTHQFPLGLIQVLALKDDAVGHDDFADIVNRRGVNDQPHFFGRQVWTCPEMVDSQDEKIVFSKGRFTWE